MTATRSLRLGNRHVPVVLPNRRDARLHTAAVIISIHLIGITALDFEVSVPQILAAILTAGLIDVALTFRQTGNLVWPASGMLTGSGVALIMRLVETRPGQYWSGSGWHWFALVAAVSVLSKHLIRFRGSHVFNPSNIGLVLAFLILGGDLVEPLDFWWAPLGPAMVAAYALIIAGGVLITRRLALLEMAVIFWTVLALGLAVLSISGHCMIAAWSPSPVCDGRFWTTLVTSPEVLIFLFFMITDPKTAPEGRAARAVFAATLAVITTLMIAPQTAEYGAKVGLLASLALLSPLRGLFDRHLGRLGQAEPWLQHARRRLDRAAPLATFTRGLVFGSSVVVLIVMVVLLGEPARQPAVAAAMPELTFDVDVDLTDWPRVEVDPSVHRLDVDVDEAFVAAVTHDLAENLAIEAKAILTANGGLLGIADGGERLDEMQARLDSAIATGERIVDRYEFERLSLGLHEAGEGQASAGLVFSGVGRVEHVHHDVDGVEVALRSEQVDLDFVLRQLGGERWVLVLVEQGGARLRGSSSPDPG